MIVDDCAASAMPPCTYLLATEMNSVKYSKDKLCEAKGRWSPPLIVPSGTNLEAVVKSHQNLCRDIIAHKSSAVTCIAIAS